MDFPKATTLNQNGLQMLSRHSQIFDAYLPSIRTRNKKFQEKENQQVKNQNPRSNKSLNASNFDKKLLKNFLSKELPVDMYEPLKEQFTEENEIKVDSIFDHKPTVSKPIKIKNYHYHKISKIETQLEYNKNYSAIDK
jgi:hypothetical protein